MPPKDTENNNDNNDEQTPLTNYGSVESRPNPKVLINDRSHSSLGSENLIESPIASLNNRVCIKTGNSTFLKDAREFRPGSIPHSMVLALSIGSLCGVAAYLYYAGLEFMLEFMWHTLPEMVYDEDASVVLKAMWIPIVGFAMALGVGLTVRFMGEPGDLPYTIQCVHEKAFVAMDHVLPMVCASQFSIVGGGSLGPEAPLVAICAALGGFVSRDIFGITDRNLVRKHTLMGMAGALAAFFGCPLGGSLFAMEVNSRFGIEYFEHTLEAILCGEVCLGVFRWLARLPIAPIWDLTVSYDGSVLHALAESSPMHVVYGICLGLLGAATAGLFAQGHFKVMAVFRFLGLIDPDGKKAVPRAMVGAVVVVGLGMLIPHTLFWGEFEIQTIATLAPAEKLEHIWPTSGLLGFEMDSFWTSLLVGVTKLVAVSFTVAGGYRGGFIFPAFAAGCALGRAIYFLCPFIPVQLCTLCMAAAINVGLTRTALATTLILAYLSDEQNCLSAILAASLVSLFCTAYMPFIPSQVVRKDMQASVFHSHEPAEVHDAEHVKRRDFVRRTSSLLNDTKNMLALGQLKEDPREEDPLKELSESEASEDEATMDV